MKGKKNNNKEEKHEREGIQGSNWTEAQITFTFFEDSKWGHLRSERRQQRKRGGVN